MNKRTFFFGLVVIGVLIFSLYRAKYGAQESADAIAAIDAEIAQEEARKLELLAEFSHRSRQEWLEEYAGKRLGMAPAKAHQFVDARSLEPRLEPSEVERGRD